MPFTVIIAEKGGAERREVFDRSEISVGRVQGNELVLPKGNVSKKHVRITYRDGRFVVTDLKSTNGTYVNGRKIAQATIVRDGDKVYIGDFVLRFEGDGAPSEMGSSSVASPGPSHYPLEQDPDDAAHAPHPNGLAPQGHPLAAAPPAPRPAGAFGPKGTAMLGASPFAPVAPPLAPVPHLKPVTPPPAPAQPHPGMSPPAAPSLPPAAAVRNPTPPPRRESLSTSAHRLALATLVDRVSEMIDLGVLATGAPAEEALATRVERAIREQVVSLRSDAEIPPDVDAEALALDARRELLELGPLGPLLADGDVSEIHVAREAVWVTRGGVTAAVEPGLTSDDSVARLVARLAVSARQPLTAGEAVVERPLSGGAALSALLPPCASSPVLLVRRARRAEGALEDPVRSGVVSRAMWTFLSQCVSARLNLLVVAAPSVSVSPLVGALIHAGDEPDRVVAVHPAGDPITPATLGVSVPLLDDGPSGAALLAHAAKVGGGWLVVGPLSGELVPAALDIASDAHRGLLAVVRGGSIRRALARLGSELLIRRSGLLADAARERLGASFDVALELARLGDGRLRVLRISELGPVESGALTVRDLFHFSVERATAGVVEGSFAPTGVVPRFVEDLRKLGVAVDPSLFDRASVRASG